MSLPSNLLIFTERITARKEYIFTHLLTELWGIDFELTEDFGYFREYRRPKFAYTRSPVGDELCQLAHGLLDEEDVRQQDIRVSGFGQTRAFFLRQIPFFLSIFFPQPFTCSAVTKNTFRTRQISMAVLKRIKAWPFAKVF